MIKADKIKLKNVHIKIKLHYNKKYKGQNQELIDECINFNKSNLGLAIENQELRKKLREEDVKYKKFKDENRENCIQANNKIDELEKRNEDSIFIIPKDYFKGDNDGFKQTD